MKGGRRRPPNDRDLRRLEVAMKGGRRRPPNLWRPDWYASRPKASMKGIPQGGQVLLAR